MLQDIRGVYNREGLWWEGRCQQQLPRNDVRTEAEQRSWDPEWMALIEDFFLSSFPSLLFLSFLPFFFFLFLVIEGLKAQNFIAVFYPGWKNMLGDFLFQEINFFICHFFHSRQATLAFVGISLFLIYVYKFVTIFLKTNWN